MVERGSGCVLIFHAPDRTRQYLVTGWYKSLNIKPGTVILYDKISLYFNLNNIGYTRLMVKQAGEIIPKKRTCKVDL